MIAIEAIAVSSDESAWLDYDITSTYVHERRVDAVLRSLLNEQRRKRITACSTCGARAQDVTCVGCGLNDRLIPCHHDSENHRVIAALPGIAFCVGCRQSGAADVHLRWLSGEGAAR